MHLSPEKQIYKSAWHRPRLKAFGSVLRTLTELLAAESTLASTTLLHPDLNLSYRMRDRDLNP